MTVRVGVIGTGFARRVQLPGLRLVPGVRVTAIASGRRPNAEAAAREFDIRHVFSDGVELARSPEVDLVIVSSTPDTHARHAIAALEAGKHVDLCRFWTGSEVVWVTGVATAMIPRRRDEHGLEREVTADDFTSFVLRLSNGAVASVLLSTVAHHGPGHLAQVTGSEGTLLLTGETKLEIGKSGGPLEDVSVADDLWERTTPNNMWARSFVRLTRDLVRVLTDGRPEGEPATFADGLAIQRVLDAVRAGGGTTLD